MPTKKSKPSRPVQVTVTFSPKGRQVYDKIHAAINKDLGMRLTHDQCMLQIAQRLGIS